MKQELHGSSTRESYYDYMVRRGREEDEKLGIDHRPDSMKIKELTQRIKQLEVDMAHVLKEQT